MYKFIYRSLYILSFRFIFPDWFYVVRYMGNIFLRETIERWSTRYPEENILPDEVLYHNMDLKMNQLPMQVLYIHILYKTCNNCIKKNMLNEIYLYFTARHYYELHKINQFQLMNNILRNKSVSFARAKRCFFFPAVYFF
jgi:hypothetical protein